MSFQIDRGLFQLDFQDYHAVLGVPVDAETKEIRKRYLKIARRLHPDSFASESEVDKQRASEFLSKLVNPAWEKLSQEKDRAEYALLLKLKGQQGVQRYSSVELFSETAKQLLSAAAPDHFYQTSLKNLTEKQYEHLDQTLELTAQISELNLAYLMYRESQGELTVAEPKKSIYVTTNPAATTQSTGPATTSKPAAAASIAAKPESPVEQSYRRAEGYFARNNYAQAILELRDALQLEPRNSRCHALMGTIYLKQNQATMARIHFNKALEIDPKNTMAVEGKRRLDLAQKAGGGKTSAAPKAPPAKSAQKPPDKPGGGLFGLFGGKKK